MLSATEFRVILEESKPALLVIKATPSDALVSVNGAPKGTAAGSESTPLVVPFPKRVAERELEVTVFKTGFQVFTKTQKLQAGQQTTLEVVLEPAQNARDPDDEDGHRPIVPTE